MEFLDFKSFRATGAAMAVYSTSETTNWKAANSDALINYRAFSAHFGLDPEKIIRLKQIHSASVRVITEADAGEGITRPPAEPGADGMITNVPGLALCTVEADCVPVYLLDPAKGAAGMIHSGWRGTAAKISANAVSLMKETYGTDPKDLLAAIGPCICRDCYEVSDDLRTAFLENFNEDAVRRFFREKGDGKYFLNLKAAIRETLADSGVIPENIEDCGFCSMHDGRFCSFRRDKNPDERMLTAIWLTR